MKIDLSKFKKLSQDDNHAVLQHPDGHEFKVAIKALHPQNRKNLDSLQMAEGGKVNNPKLAESKKQPKKAEKLEIEKLETPQTKNGIEVEEVKPLEVQQIRKYADGGMVAIKKENYDDSKMKRVGYADGGEIDYQSLIPEEQAANAPYGTSSQLAGPQVPAQQGVASPDQAPLAVNIPGVTEQPQAPQSVQQFLVPPESQDRVPNSAPPIQVTQPQTVEAPTTLGGYQKQAEAIKAEANAQEQMANQQEAVMKSKVQASMNLMDKYQDQYNQLDTERKALIDDIRNQHIDPNRYMGSMDTGQKILTGIAVALGSFGGGPNVAAEFLQKNIDNDIAAQRAEIGKKENLLSANLRQFGNMKDAIDMTKIMMNDITKSQIEQSIAKAQAPIAKARGQQLLGQLEAQTAPMVQQMAMRQMLANQGGGALNADPSQFVPSLVPEARQKDVYGEIKRAEDVKQVAGTALKNFDRIAKRMQAAGGLGRVGTALYEPAEAQALQADLGTTVADMEGTVREQAMHNVMNAYLPRATDTAERLVERRKQLEHYLALKSSAPTAKSYGIDLERFQSSARQPEPEVQVFNGAKYQKVAGGWKLVK